MAKLEIPIDAKVLYKMYEYAAYAETHFDAEVAGWGHYNTDNGIYKLAPLLKQTVSGAEVDTFPDAIINDTKYDISDMVVQWHSHVFMSTSPSGTDKGLIKEALKLFPVLISIIVNCKHEYSARLDARKMGTDHCSIELDDPVTYDVELVPYYDNPAINKEVLKKLSKPKPVEIKVVKTIPVYAPPEHRHWEGGYNWKDDYTPPSSAAASNIPDIKVVEPSAEVSILWDSEEDYIACIERAEMLEIDFPEEFAKYNFGDGQIIVNSITTGHYAIISPEGLEVNGMISDWKHFLTITGLISFHKYQI